MNKKTTFNQVVFYGIAIQIGVESKETTINDSL